MVEQYQRRSALAHLSLALRTKPMNEFSVTLAESQRRMIINLRGEGNAFTDALYRVAKLHLPKANRVQTQEGFSLFWLGPNEYFLTGPEKSKEEITTQLRMSLGSTHYALTDLSESRTILRIEGEKARDVLIRGMSIDLHPSVFSQGQCAQTSLGKVNVLLHQIDDQPSYEIYVWNSFADYCWRWLEKVSAQFGCKIKV